MTKIETTLAPRLQVRGICKRFPGVVALEKVDLKVGAGEILGIVGENGAGKSTLMKILAGIEQADDGQICIEGSSVEIDSVQSALNQGIALIHQELSLAANLPVAANIFLGREPRRFGWIDTKELNCRARRMLDQVGLDVDPGAITGELSIGQQQLVEIARALSIDARILIMDEPTSSLSQRDTEVLFRVIKRLCEQGVSIIYISHRLGEMEQLADRVVALRDGIVAGQLRHGEIHHDAMVRLMVGRDLSQFYVRSSAETVGGDLLQVKDLVVPAHSQHRLNLSIRRGEIVGLAGLVGAGRTELLEALFGIAPALSGEIVVGKRRLRHHRPADAIDAGVALVPEDRKQQGVFLQMAIRTNVGLTGLDRHCGAGGWVDVRRERDDAARMIERLRIKTHSDLQTVETLSGGNQQKVVLAKWLSLDPQVLLLDEPTRGVDVGAKREIYLLMEELAGRGVAILFASSEMEEILGMSDRVLVMHNGAIAGELARDQLSEEAVMQLATGRSLRVAS